MGTLVDRSMTVNTSADCCSVLVEPIADTHAIELANVENFLHVMADLFEHPANLAIDSLSQDNAQAHRRQGVESRNPCSLAV